MKPKQNDARTAETILAPAPFPTESTSAGSICFHCRRDVYGLQAIGAVKVCGRSDCLLAALDTVARRANAA